MATLAILFNMRLLPAGNYFAIGQEGIKGDERLCVGQSGVFEMRVRKTKAGYSRSPNARRPGVNASQI